MNRDIKFKVYYEAELNGEKLKGIEEPCSWFLLTQTGQIMEYGPMRPPSKPNKSYTKLIPLFFTGLLDKQGKEIYEFMEINGKYKVIYKAPQYVLTNIANGDIFSFGEVIKNENEITITKEYAEI